MPLEVSTFWATDLGGYELIPAEPEGSETGVLGQRREARVRGRRGRQRFYDPLGIDELYLRFAAVSTPDQALAFAGRFGLLTSQGGYEPVATFLEHAAAFRALIGMESSAEKLTDWAGLTGRRL